MFTLRSATFVLGLTAAVAAQPVVDISIGVRETGVAGATFSMIGGDGGTSGDIEWVNLDGQQLTLDGTWQLFTFNITTDPITGFAGATVNGVIDGTFGTLEHVRVLNSGNVLTPIALFIDDVANTITPGGGSPMTTTFGVFETYASGQEAMFQEPTFSGSTSGNVAAGGTSGVDNLVASRSASCRFDFQFVNNSWVRLTTFRAQNQPNPLIRFDDASVVTFWMRGGECQPDLGSQGPGTAFSEICGWGLNTGESSIYSIAGAPAGAPGALAISAFGLADLPVLGGVIVSGTGLVTTIPIAAGGAGTVSFVLPGSGAVLDFAIQSVFADGSLPMGVAFTNAIQAKFGQ